MWKSAFICVKGCEGSNSVWLQKVVRVGSAAECGEWATASRFQSLCVSLFDQASPGPQEHSFNTSSKRTKRPLSAVSHLHPASTQWHPGTNSGRARPPSFAGALSLKRTLKRTGRSIKHRGDTLAVDKHQHKSMQRWLPGRCEKTECSASGDKEKEGSGVMGRCQLKSLCKVKHNTLFFFYFGLQTLWKLHSPTLWGITVPTSQLQNYLL